LFVYFVLLDETLQRKTILIHIRISKHICYYRQTKASNNTTIKMGCLKGFGKFYLVCANVITALLGLGVIGCASYALIQFNEFSDMFSKVGLGAAVGAGVLTFLVSLSGCYGAMKQNKCLLAIYVAAMTLTFLVFVAGGIGVAIYKGALLEITDGSKAVALTNDFQQKINSYELKTFSVCCAKPDGYPEPQPCTDTNQFGCYTDVDAYNNFAANAICEGLKEIDVNGHPIVGDKPSCGNGNALQFQKDISTFVDDNATYMIAGTATVAVLQFLCLLFSCCLVCENREEYDPEYKARKQAQAGQFTGTQGAAIASNGTNYV